MAILQGKTALRFFYKQIVYSTIKTDGKNSFFKEIAKLRIHLTTQNIFINLPSVFFTPGVRNETKKLFNGNGKKSKNH